MQSFSRCCELQASRPKYMSANLPKNLRVFIESPKSGSADSDAKGAARKRVSRMVKPSNGTYGRVLIRNILVGEHAF